jgi:hypothetical protein
VTDIFLDNYRIFNVSISDTITLTYINCIYENLKISQTGPLSVVSLKIFILIALNELYLIGAGLKKYYLFALI